MFSSDLNDFDDVERRKTERRTPHSNDACMTHDEHHDTCREQFTTLKEYMCLKMKPVNDSITRLTKETDALKNIMVIIVIGLLGGGLWTAFAGINTSSLQKNLEHVKSEHKEIKDDFSKQLDKVERTIHYQLQQNKDELNAKIDREISRVIEEIRKAEATEHHE